MSRLAADALVILVLLAAACAYVTQPVLPSGGMAGRRGADPVRLETHVRALSERFSPRGNRNLRNLAAAGYIADMLRAAGGQGLPVRDGYDTWAATYEQTVVHMDQRVTMALSRSAPLRAHSSMPAVEPGGICANDWEQRSDPLSICSSACWRSRGGRVRASGWCRRTSKGRCLSQGSALMRLCVDERLKARGGQDRTPSARRAPSWDGLVAPASRHYALCEMSPSKKVKRPKRKRQEKRLAAIRRATR